MSKKNSNDTIGNRTRDLPACTAVPQPTALPRAPRLILKLELNAQKCLLFSRDMAAVSVNITACGRQNLNKRITLLMESDLYWQPKFLPKCLLISTCNSRWNSRKWSLQEEANIFWGVYYSVRHIKQKKIWIEYPFLTFRGPCIASIFLLTYFQKDATLHSYLFLENCSTYFEWYLHPYNLFLSLTVNEYQIL